MILKFPEFIYYSYKFSVLALKVLSEYPTELDGIHLHLKKVAATSKPEKVGQGEKAGQSDAGNEEEGVVAENGQYYVDSEKVERHSQFLITTMASQNKV